MITPEQTTGNLMGIFAEEVQKLPHIPTTVPGLAKGQQEKDRPELGIVPKELE